MFINNFYNYRPTSKKAFEKKMKKKLKNKNEEKK